MHGSSDERGFAQLPGTGDAAACVWLRDALMVDGLTMTTNEVERIALRSRLARLAVGLAQPPVESRKLGSRCLRRVHCGKNRFAQRRGVGKCAMADEFDTRTGTRGRDTAERNVDAVGRGAAHDAGDEHRLLFHSHAVACAVLAATMAAKASTASRMVASSNAFGGDGRRGCSSF